MTSPLSRQAERERTAAAKMKRRARQTRRSAKRWILTPDEVRDTVRFQEVVFGPDWRTTANPALVLAIDAALERGNR